MLRVKFGDLPLFLIKEHLGAARGHPSLFLGDHGWEMWAMVPGAWLLLIRTRKGRWLPWRWITPRAQIGCLTEENRLPWIHPSFCFSSSHANQMLSLTLPIKKSPMRLQLALIWSTFIITPSSQPVREAAFPQHDFVSGGFNRANHLQWFLSGFECKPLPMVNFTRLLKITPYVTIGCKHYNRKDVSIYLMSH